MLQLFQESSLHVEFGLDVYLAFQHRKRYHKCQLMMSAVHPLGKWDITCSHYFVSYYGRLNDPCSVYGKINELCTLTSSFLLPSSTTKNGYDIPCTSKTKVSKYPTIASLHQVICWKGISIHQRNNFNNGSTNLRNEWCKL